MTAKAQILDMAQRLADANSKDAERGLVKGLIVRLWQVLPVSDREAFISRIGAGYPYDFIEWNKRFPDANDPELENVARHWGYVLPTLYGDDRQFGRSFEKLIRFHRTPSEKQAAWAKRLYSDWKSFSAAEAENPEDIEVME
jgi:hypothetical protein